MSFRHTHYLRLAADGSGFDLSPDAVPGSGKLMVHKHFYRTFLQLQFRTSMLYARTVCCIFAILSIPRGQSASIATLVAWRVSRVGSPHCCVGVGESLPPGDAYLSAVAVRELKPLKCDSSAYLIGLTSIAFPYSPVGGFRAVPSAANLR